MSDAAITIQLPADLVERAKAAGLNIEAETAWWVMAVEREIERRKAGKELREIAEKLRAIPDEDKPSEEEIVRMVKQARRELAAAQGAYDRVLGAALAQSSF